MAVWSKTLGVMVRHEQALETVEMSDEFCGLSVHASMITEAGVMNCRLMLGSAVVVTVAVAVGTVIASTSIPVMTVVVVVTVVRPVTGTVLVEMPMFR